MNEIKTYSREALEYWGYEPQSTMTIEEMAELTKALCKYKRYGYEHADKDIKENLLEEIADVHNMIDQLELYFGPDIIADIRKAKLIRTHEKIQQLRGKK